jgi:hypothetical protein
MGTVSLARGPMRAVFLTSDGVAIVVGYSAIPLTADY